MEKLARDKEEKFAAELKALDRRKELLDRIAQIGEEEKKVSANCLCLSIVRSLSLSNYDAYALVVAIRAGCSHTSKD
jgi:hypothetical protein